jgi:hypothetical protein
LKPILENHKVCLAKISVWESERSCASYGGGQRP